MGKKGSWLSALKRAFTSNSKDRPINGYDNKHIKEKKKWGLGRSKNGEVNSFIPLYREPSSIEKILGDAEREQEHMIHHVPPKKEVPPKKDQLSRKKEVSHKQELPTPKTEVHHLKQDQAPSKTEVTPKKELQPPKKELPPKKEVHPPKKEVPPKRVQQLKTHVSKPTTTVNYVQISAIKIQAAYRGYTARKSYRSLKGLMRLQGVMRGSSVKRQTMNAMKCMQLLVRVQSQIRTRRLQMIESRNNQQNQIPGKSDKEIESTVGRWSLTPQSEAEENEEWDDSMLAMEEIDARTRRKVEAVIKRERALAYAYSHQLLKVTPKSAHAVLSDIRTGGYPLWWNWLERQALPIAARPNPNIAPTMPTSIASDAVHLRPASRSSQVPAPQKSTFNASTPRSSKPMDTMKFRKPGISSSRWSVRDDDSLTSCPLFTVPNYMAPTVSAKAKVREGPGAGAAAAAGGEGRRRFSFGLSQSISSLRWGKHKDSCAPSVAATVRGMHRPVHSVGNLSIDSTVSLPTGFVGRKPFK